MTTPPSEPSTPIARDYTSPRERLTLASMTSEALREAAVLVGVFGWLDKAAHDEVFFEGGWPIVVCGGALVPLPLRRRTRKTPAQCYFEEAVQ